MSTEPRIGLLGPEDPEPVVRSNVSGAAPFLLTGDHAGSAIPRSLGTLGLHASELDRHIACDAGVKGLGEALAARLDAPFIHQAYSRLVIDCNRDPPSDEAIPLMSDGTRIAGNAMLTPAARRSRIAEIHEPYHSAIGVMLANWTVVRQAPILVALHSFTPVMAGVVRPWDVGVLHDGANELFARRVLRALRSEAGLNVGDNQPYRMDATDYTVPRHAFGAGLAYVEIEVREDRIADTAGQWHWAELIAAALMAAVYPG